MPKKCRTEEILEDLPLEPICLLHDLDIPLRSRSLGLRMQVYQLCHEWNLTDPAAQTSKVRSRAMPTHEALNHKLQTILHTLEHKKTCDSGYRILITFRAPDHPKHQLLQIMPKMKNSRRTSGHLMIQHVGNTKVTDLYSSVHSLQQVSRFEVSMDDLHMTREGSIPFKQNTPCFFSGLELEGTTD